MSNETIVFAAKPVCFVGGSALRSQDINDISQWVDGFVAVDSGADALLAAGITPKAVIGDMDSISAKARATFARSLYMIAEQSTTDFEKALTRVSAPAIIAVGFTGGRMDHTLSVLGVMARFPGRPVLLADTDDVSFVAQAGRTVLTLPQDTRISLMPVVPVTVSLAGVAWQFTQTLMEMDGFTSPSNAALGGDVTIEADAPVLVTLPRAFLGIALKAVARAQ